MDFIRFFEKRIDKYKAVCYTGTCIFTGKGGNPMGIFSKLFGSYSTRELARIEPIKQKVLALDEEYTALSDAELKGKTQEFRDRLESLMRTLNVDENTPIESKSLSKIIESSQKKVEGRNFSIRKNVLNYDDVMNTQREIIYKERQQVLDGEDLHDSILKMMEELISDTVKQYINEEVVDRTQWNLVGLKDHFLGWITEENDLEYEGEDLEKLTVDTLIETLTEKAKSLYAAREEQYGSDVIRELERVVMLKVVDTKWMAHIDDMSELKKGIGLRAYGQQNPVVEYRYEGFEMFDAMVASIKEDTIRMLLTMQLRQNQAPEREQVSKPDAPNAGAGDGSFGTQRRNPARAAKKNQK